MAKIKTMTMSVNINDLKTMASFACEHPNAPCDKHDLERGGCCNACWAARWAQQMLDGKKP
jgi:hypothetical protein